jgi:hypothetical protein
MTGLKKNSLLLLLTLGLVSAACGDDDKPDPDGDDGAEDGTPTDGGDGTPTTVATAVVGTCTKARALQTASSTAATSRR